MPSLVTRIGFILKPDKSAAGVVLERLAAFVRARGATPVVTTEDHHAPPGAEIVPENELGRHVELGVVLGGDGTLLRAARLLADAKRPVLGINLGQLGFLTGFRIEDAEAALAQAMEGALSVSSRMRLAVALHRDGAPPLHRTALNDAVIHQGAMARLVDVNAQIDGAFVADYRADGLIVSTPTGSTAYNMAAGGPIVAPGVEAMILTPICAHALTNRPLVVPPKANLHLRLGADTRGVVLTVDGQWAHSFLPGDRVEITSAAEPLRLFASPQSYFDIMRDKLHWGMRSGRP